VGEVLKVELACRGLWIRGGKLDHQFELQGISVHGIYVDELCLKQ
jgi:hypothetical protein